jgi:hypothetical protein
MANSKVFGTENWNPWGQHVQGGLRDNNYLTGKNTLLCVGPPFLQALGSAATSNVYPIGLAQNFAIAQNSAVQQLHEIGSEKPYFFRGRTVRQVTLGRIVFHGPSLLRVMYAWYYTGSQVDNEAGGISGILDVFDGSVPDFLQPFSSTGTASDYGPSLSGELPSVKVQPGYDNLWLNLASDIFRVPTGIMVLLRDTEDNTVGAYYLEQCMIPTHTMAVDSQGLIIQETITIIPGNIVPINTNAVKLVTAAPNQQPEFGMSTNASLTEI